MSKKILKFFIFFLTFIIHFPSFFSNANAEDLSQAKSAVLIEANGAQILYQRNADLRLPMASTTKIMTALTALEYCSPEQKLTVPAQAVGTEGTSASLCEGEVYTLEELLLCLLLQSANDAAVAIAVNIGGSVEGFATLMNHRAEVLGLCDTNFKNPHGLPHEEHYTSARELALIAFHALKNEVIREIVATKTATVISDGGKTTYLYNHNKLLSNYDGANGVKTGYTKASGRCLVSSATRGSLTLIAVTLGSHNDWNEHKAMLDYGFGKYESVSTKELCSDAVLIPIVDKEKEYFAYAAAPETFITIKKGEKDKIIAVAEYPRFLYLSQCDKGTVGRLVYKYDGKVVSVSPLILNLK